jgi:hypothetical protein
MSGLNVVFQVPAHLEAGLYAGVLERVGGVIRDRASKQVVAWLREGVQTANPSLNPIHLVMQMAQAGVTLWDGHKTRQAIDVVGQQVMTLTQLTAAGQVVNLAMASLSLTQMLKKLTQLSQQISQLEATILAEFNRDRVRRFETALEAARDAFESQNPNQRDLAARKAIDDLFSARQDFLEDFSKIMAKDMQKPDRLKLAEHTLLNALYAHMSRIRCYWAMGDTGQALRRLNEDLPIFRQHIESLVRARLQPSPARYFERNVSSDDLAQFMTVQQWLRGETGPMTTSTMFAIVDELRQSFWDLSIFGNTFQRTVPFVGKKRHPLTESLQGSQALIENHRRLEGFGLEIETAHLSLEGWENFVDHKKLSEYGGALILDPAALNKVRV